MTFTLNIEIYKDFHARPMLMCDLHYTTKFFHFLLISIFILCRAARCKTPIQRGGWTRPTPILVNKNRYVCLFLHFQNFKEYYVLFPKIVCSDSPLRGKKSGFSYTYTSSTRPNGNTVNILVVNGTENDELNP